MKGSGIQMKKNLQKMQVKAINKRAILESHDGEEFSLITVAKNVLCEDGTTMQDYFDNHSEPNISTKIVNSNSMSKVGQGDNVDFSDNVMNGAYEDVVLKGKSLVNVIQEPSSQDVVLPYAFEEGERVTINDTKETGAIGIELQGQTLVNLAINGSNKIYRGVNSTTKLAYTIQANKLYYLVVHVKSNTLNKPFRFSGYTLGKNATKMPESDIGGDKDIFDIGEVGKKRFKVGYTEIVENAGTDLIMFAQNTDTLEGSATYDIMLLEYQEGMEDWDIPYFEGMTSVTTPTVKTCGKNLVYPTVGSSQDGSLLVDSNNQTVTINKDSYTGDCYYYGLGNSHLIPIEPNVKYVCSFKKLDGEVSGVDESFIQSAFAVLDESLTVLQWAVNSGMRTDHANARYISKVRLHWSNKPANFTNFKFTMQLEKADTPTTHELHQSSLLTLPEEVVLRSLPNGICDTYNTKIKEYTQRIGEIVLDGSEDEEWGYNEGGSIQGKKCFNLPWELTPNRKQYGYAICDHMPITTTLDKVGVYNGQGLNILIDSNSNDVGVLKEILASKPITVQYELATPIVTEIDLPSLKAYNTVTHLSSTVGEGSLVPKLASDDTISYPVVIKPNTKYSIVAHKDRNNHSNHLNYTFDLGGATTTCSVNDTIATVTTPSTLYHQELRVKGQGLAISSVRVVEGEVTQDLPYFEGICDVKSPTVKNVGKNLFDINGEVNEKFSNMLSDTKPNTIEGNTVIASSCTSFHHGKGQKIKVKCGESYTCSFTTSNEGRIIIHTPNKINFTGSKTSTFTFTTPTDCDEVTIAFNTAGNTGGGKIHNLCVVEGVIAPTECEPYKSNTTTFTSNDDEIIVLRSLPNGVCDTLNVKTGEYIQIIGEITLDGTKRDDLVYHTVLKDNDGDFIRMIINGCSFYDNNKYGNCDKLPFYHEEKTKDSVEAVFPFAGEKHFCIKIKTSRINGAETMENNSSQLRDAFLNWLAQNPITVQYELATPIVKQANVEGYPYAYENGHILLESGSQEQSLTPTIEYSIVANRGGQIRSNQRMVERHQKKLDSLYAMTLVNMIDSQYNQTLMELKSDLPKSEVRTWDIE